MATAALTPLSISVAPHTAQLSAITIAATAEAAESMTGVVGAAPAGTTAMAAAMRRAHPSSVSTLTLAAPMT